MHEQTEYEKLRETRIAENEEMFKQLFPVQAPRTPKGKDAAKNRPNTERISRTLLSRYPSRRNPSRNCRGKRKVRYGSDNEDEDCSSDYDVGEDTFEEQDGPSQGSMVVKLWSSMSKNSFDSPEKKRRYEMLAFCL